MDPPRCPLGHGLTVVEPGAVFPDPNGGPKLRAVLDQGDGPRPVRALVCEKCGTVRYCSFAGIGT